MSEADYQRLMQFNHTLHHCFADPFCNVSQLTYHNATSLYDLNVPGDGSPLLRAVISLVYCAVHVVGVMGNSLVLYLLHTTRGTRKCAINCFVFNLAIADFLFSMALPFWAIDVALDYSWPFGVGFCKLMTFLTALSSYASVFFLTAISVARYQSVASALKPAKPASQNIFAVRLTTALIWLVTLLFTSPRAVFAGVSRIGTDQACLLQFPEGTFWLALHHLLRVIFGFLIPYWIIAFSYIFLLCFLCNQPLSRANRLRQSKVSNSVAIMVLSFCICWLPYNVVTTWGVLINLDLVEWTDSYYKLHTYVFPLTTCLAHINSCLNPIIYCLMLKEYRKLLVNLLWKSSLSSMFKVCLSAMSYSTIQTQKEHLAVPFNNVKSQAVQSCTKRSMLPSTTLFTNPSPKNLCPLNDV